MHPRTAARSRQGDKELARHSDRAATLPYLPNPHYHIPFSAHIFFPTHLPLWPTTCPMRVSSENHPGAQSANPQQSDRLDCYALFAMRYASRTTISAKSRKTDTP
jgi:hypothetical protein